MHCAGTDLNLTFRNGRAVERPDRTPSAPEPSQPSEANVEEGAGAGDGAGGAESEK